MTDVSTSCVAVILKLFTTVKIIATMVVGTLVTTNNSPSQDYNEPQILTYLLLCYFYLCFSLFLPCFIYLFYFMVKVKVRVRVRFRFRFRFRLGAIVSSIYAITISSS